MRTGNAFDQAVQAQTTALFGMGWGIAGYCPGPALANLAHATEAIAFVLALVAGSQLARLATSRT